MKKLTVLFIACISFSLFAQPGAFSLIAPSNGGWGSATPTFQWGAATSASFYRLYIDNTLFKDNLTAVSYQLASSEALTEAMHTWYIMADNASSDTTRSSQTWSVRIDVTPPAAFNLAGPSDGSWTNSQQPTFQWAASSDGGSGVAKYQLWVDGVLNRDSIAGTSTSASPAGPLTNGSHAWQVKALDSVANTQVSNETRTIKIDDIPPGIPNISALEFNASTHTFVDTRVSSRITYNFTIETWVKFSQDGSGNPRIISSEADNTGDDGYSLFTVGTGATRKVSFYVGGIGTITGYMNLSAGTFYHVAATISGNQAQSQMILYVNGNAAAIQYFSGTITNGWYPLEFGRKGWGSNYYDCFSGIIDEVRIWAICRTQSQIIQYMKVPLQGTEEGLLGYWKCDENFGTIAYDQTSNHNDGTIYSAAFESNDLPNISSLCMLKVPNKSAYLSNPLPAFSWGSAVDSGIGFQKYQLWVDGNLSVDNLSDSSCVISTPLGYGQHAWYVKGFDLLGNNQSSSPQVLFIDNQPPSPFNLLTPLDSAAVNIPTPNLSWQATADSAGGIGLSKYQLWINGVKNIDSIPASTTTSAPNAVLAEGSYSWFVKAIDKLGNVRTSPTRTFFVDYNPPAAFALISPANGDSVKTSHPQFVWHKSVDAGSSVVRYVLNVSGQIPDTIASADTSVQFPTALSNGSYTWFVVAYDRGNNSKSTETGNFVENFIPAAVPVLSSPSNGSINQPLSSTLVWNAAAGASTYWAQLSTSPSFLDSNRVWTKQTSGMLNLLIDVTWGNNQFVAVGRKGSILTSPDGLAWTARASGTSADLAGVAWGNDRYVAVGDSGTIITSPDGKTWTVQTSWWGTYYSYYFYKVVWGNNTFVAVTSSGLSITSPDGKTWTSHTSSNGFEKITWGNNQFVAICFTGDILTSSDGIAWTHRTSGTSRYLYGVAWGDNTFVVVGENGTILTSPDGVIWTARSSGTSHFLSGVAGGDNQFIVVSDSGKVLTSLDGVAWKAGTTGTSFSLEGVACGNSHFVVVGDSGTILSSESFIISNDTSLSSTSESKNGLSLNTTYYWRVRSNNEYGSSAWSEPWNFTTGMQTQVPAQVSIIFPANASTITVDSVVVVWFKSTPNVDRYSLKLFTDSLLTTVALIDSSVTDTARTCKGLANKSTFWCRINAHNSAGWGSYSDKRKFTVNIPTTAILPKTFSFKFSGMSASNSFIRYSLPKVCNVSFRLFNVQGKLIRTFINAEQSSGYYQIPLNIADLSRGCYLMDFKAGSFAVKRKMSNF